jgi:hypothetical protein
MMIDSANAAMLRDIFDAQDTDRLETLNVDALSLGALVELTCTDASLRPNGIWNSFYSALRREFPVLDATATAFHGASAGQAPQIERVDAPVEIHSVATTNNFQDQAWITFQENFVRRLRSCGFEKNFSFALAGAFNELAENIADHSAAADQSMAAGVIGYHIMPGEAHFAVGDIGRGALESLRENPRWDGLENCTQALEAILWSHATRKQTSPQGGGFNQVWKSFLDRNGTLMIHSGDGYARALVTSDGREQIAGFRSFLRGFRVFGSCFLRGTPEEKALEKDLTHMIT